METSAIEMFRSTVCYQNELIWVKPLCDFFKLHDKNQYRKIKSDPILGKMVGKNRPSSKGNGKMVGFLATDLGQIDDYGRILLSRKGFIRWIQIINVNTIDENLRDRFVKYQELVFDYLYGSLEEEKETKLHYDRLRKLERIYKKIGAEIKKEKKALEVCLENKYQLRLSFKNTNRPIK